MWWILKNKEIMTIEEKIWKQVQETQDYGLLHGKMGVCVSMFVLGRHNAQSPYHKQAELLLGDIIKSIGKVKCIDLENGLLGLALGFRFLIQGKYVRGTTESYLQDLDNYIYKLSCKTLGMELSGKDTKTLSDVLLYASLRYGDIENPYRKEWYRRFLVELFNAIYQKHTNAFYREALPFAIHTGFNTFLYALLRIRALGMEQGRIDNILHEMQYSLFSCMPMLNPNRLCLYVAVSLVAQATKKMEWREYGQLLRAHIDFQNILTRDLYDMNVSPNEGVIGIYLLAKLYGTRMEDAIPLDMDMVRQRVVKSAFLRRLEADEDFLGKNYSLNGYYGIKVFLDCTHDE